MRVVVAMDKFRGTLTAVQACDAVADGVRRAGHDAVSVPMSDGGEGFVDAFGGANRTTSVTSPQGFPVDAGWRLDGTRAVIESAAASGLALLDDRLPRDAVAATSRGTGELIGAAIEAGAREIWVGIGGTGCSDGGQGAVDALDKYLRPDIPVSLAIFVDVTTRFTDAAREFGPQKGATPDEVGILTRRLQQQSATYAERFGRRIDLAPGTGAGGGLAGGLAAIGGEIRSGFAAIAAAAGLDTRIATADLVITGEGKFDPPSLSGKVVGGVLRLAADADVPAVVLAGTVDPEVRVTGRITVRSLTAEFGRQRAWGDAASALAELAHSHLAR